MEHSDAAKMRWANSEYREKQAKAREAAKELKAQSMRERWADPEYRAKQDAASPARSERMRKLHCDPEFQRRMVEGIRSPDESERRSESRSAINKAKWQDPEYRAKHTARLREMWNRPGFREKMSRAGKNSGMDNPAFKHGGATRKNRSPEFTAFYAAKGRCTNPKQHKWKDYGGRGIKFLFTSFEQFLAEIGRRPSAAHSLDRFPNNNGNYEPGNVRWATQAEQVANRRPSTEWQYNCPACGELFVCPCTVPEYGLESC